MSNINAPVVIHNNTNEPRIGAEEKAAFDKAVEIAFRYSASVTVERVDVFINPRGVLVSSPEWLEHLVKITYVNPDRGFMTIGVLQRTIGADIESHS